MASTAGVQPKLQTTYGKLPLSFEPNRGQSAAQVKFLSRGSGYTLFLTGDEAVLSLRSQKLGVRSQEQGRHPWSLVGGRMQKTADYRRQTADSPELTTDLSLGPLIPNLRSQIENLPVPSPQNPAPDVVRLRLLGANPAATEVGEEELPGKSNYFIGNDPKKWRTNVSDYAKVRYKSVYPGVDLVYYGNQRQLEFDFVVAPGADPNVIALDVAAGSPRHPSSYNGGENPPLQIGSDGNLAVKMDGGDVRFHKPVVYQPASAQDVAISSPPRESTRLGLRTSDSGLRNVVDGRFVLTASNQVRFALGPYDHNRSLVIDPVLVYSTFLGGSGDDLAFGIAVDSSGNAYVAGSTDSTNFPTFNPFQANNHGGPADDEEDAFVSKISADGSALVYSTYLGGNGIDVAYAIAVDPLGNAYVTGGTVSSNFPTVNPVQASNRGGYDAFAVKLSVDGSALIYSTYLGGGGDDQGNGIALDSSGNVYISGQTTSPDFPIAQPMRGGGKINGGHQNFNWDAFVAKLNPAGSALVYSSYLGGSGDDWGESIAVDSSGNAYVTGQTQSTDFPTVNPIQATHSGGGWTAFVTKVNPAGSALAYSTYLGGTKLDFGHGIAVDGVGNAYVTGYTWSTDFPTANPLQATLASTIGANAFVTKLNATGSALTYSTYLGGSNFDQANGIAVDAGGNAYVTGFTWSTDFPTVNPVQAASSFNPDAFVAKLNADGSALTYSTYLGGSGADTANGIAVDSAGNTYFTGTTNSTDFPTMNAFQSTCDNCVNYSTTYLNDAFVAKISAYGTGVGLSSYNLSFGSQPINSTSAVMTVNLTNIGTTTLNVTGLTAGGDFALVNTSTSCPYGGGVVASQSTCTIDITFTPTTTGATTGAITIVDDVPGSPQSVSLSGTGVLFMMSLSPTSMNLGSEVINTTSTAKPLTITNTGTVPLVVSSVGVTGDFAAASVCFGPVNPGRNCKVDVTFTPTALGTQTGTVTVDSNASNNPQTVSLTGTGVVSATLMPTGLSFGNVAMGASSAGKTITLTNNQSVSLTNISVSILGTNDYPQTNTCGSLIGAKQKCTITVTFTPSIIGADNATLSIADSAANSPQTTALTGTGTVPVTLMPASATYASQKVGTTSAAKTFTLTSNLNTTLNSIGISTSGDFAVSSTTCGTSLAARGKCTINVTFTPTTTGSRAGTLTASDNAGNSPQTAQLSGTGK